MSSDNSRYPLDRRDFLKTAGIFVAGAAIYPSFACAPERSTFAAAGGARPGWTVQPFPLNRVSILDGVFQQKRDRMLNYLRNYGSDTDMLAGPDRMLSIFRANAGLDTRGAEPPGSWEDENGYLRGHYAGHYMSALAQAYAETGDPVYKEKLDYMVSALAECQAALAAAAAEPTPRVAGRHGTALRLTGSPIGHVEHVRLPDGTVNDLQDFTVATWMNLHEYDPDNLPGANRNQMPASLNNQAAVFDFGTPSSEYAGAPQSRMYLVVRISDDQPVPRFAITTGGEDNEQRLDGSEPIPVDEWTHLAVTRSGNTGTLYMNGQAVATHRNMTLSPADVGVTDHWLGRHQFPQRSISYLNAELDEFQIYGRALRADEVRSLLDSAGGTAGGGDVAWYRFDEVNGPTATDSSGNGRDATIIAPTDGARHPGFLSAYPETQFIRLEEFCTYGSTQGIWAPYYTLHKIVAGLIDSHVVTDNEQALGILTGIGDWVWTRLEPLGQEQLRRMWDIYIAGEYGGVNESLAYLQALTGNEDYLAAARKFDNAAVMNPIVAGEDILDGRHANQHIPQFTGYLRVFEEGRDARYYDAAKNFWDMVVPHRIYSHGGTGVGEMFAARNYIAGGLFDERNHAETCPVYNMLKLSRNLFFHDPQPKYMNYYEQALFNQILASRRDQDSTESPEVTYFVPVRPGQRRSYGNTGTCCGGTGMENHTKYQDSVYFRSVDGSELYVNLYIPSVLDWEEEGFTIRQETRYPLEGSSTLTVDGRGPLDIKLRVPAWVRKGYTVRVNGQVQDLDAVPGEYVTLSRRWRRGDTIDIDMPFSFRTERAIDDPTVQSIFYGPTLLVVENPPVGDDLQDGLMDFSFYRHLKLDGDLAPAMTPADEPLVYTTNGRTLAPFFVADPEDVENPDATEVAVSPFDRRRRGPRTQPYHMYFRRTEPQVVFGSSDAGVANPAREDGLSFLDAVWDQAPFASHADFVATVERTADEWATAGQLPASSRDAVVDAARRAEADLRV
ncbi:MAG: glycoside hydrolase family 127 protein [Gemmatimonadetes bacterium]|nr:glycoside hydrolase family 127 protein [Gemmatimonadota bacterium]